MDILGQTYSRRIDKLYDRLKELVGADVVFDNLIEPDDVFGSPDGQYHSGEHPPRISVRPTVNEATVAHELLHGILCYTGYPGWSNGFRKRFPYASDTAREICHCCIHIVIDQKLEHLGYDVVGLKSAFIETCISALPRKGESVTDLRGKHWWRIRIACESARQVAPPSIAPILTNRFAEQAKHHFPSCEILAKEFTAISREMDTEDPRSIQRTMWGMLQAVQSQYGKHPHCASLTKKAVLIPLYVTSGQLRRPANRLIKLEEGRTTDSKAGSTGRFIMIVHKKEGRTLTITENLSERAFAQEKKHLKRLIDDQLRNALDHCKIKYFEPDENQSP